MKVAWPRALRVEHVAAITGVVVLTLVAVFDPSTSGLFPPCPFRATTGWLCPGCGAARALHALLHGHLLEALETNAFAVAALPVAGLDMVGRVTGSGGLPTQRIPPRSLLALAAGLVLFGILRNL